MNFLDLYEETTKDLHNQSRDSNVLIVDSLNRFISVWAAVPALNKNGDHIGGIAGFLKSIGSMIRQFNVTRCILVFDGKGGSQRRRKIFSDYKAKRKVNVQLNRTEFSSVEDEQFSMRHQMSRILQYLDQLPVDVLCIENIEADDTIANIVTSYYENTNSKITIASSDRDFLQLVNDRVQVWSPIKKKLYGISEIEEEFGIKHTNYLLYRVVTGDNSDNIPGVKGVGLKTLIKEFDLNSDTRTVEYLLETSRERILDKKPKKLFQSIVENEDRINLNHRLMQLDTSDISLYSKNQIRDSLNSKPTILNKPEFMRMFSEDFLHESIKDPDRWLLETFSNLNYWCRQ